MYKLANQIIDVYDDIYMEHLVKLGSKGPHINVMTPEEKLALGDDDYALCYITKEGSKINKFPIHDMDNTWLSNEYFPNTYTKLSSEASATAAFFIKKACERFGIEPTTEVVKVASSNSKGSNLYIEPRFSKTVSADLPLDYLGLNKTEKTASVPYNELAEIDRICSNYTHAQQVFSTPEMVKAACHYFEQKHEKMPMELRHKYAAAIQVRSEELGMGIQKGTVSKYASDAYSADVDAHIASRRRLLDVSPAAGELSKLAALKNSYTPSEFAQRLHDFDKKASLDKYYGGYLKNPYEATFSSGIVPQYSWMNKTGSKNISEDDIKKVVSMKSDKIAEYIGKNEAEAMKKDPVAVFDSLPNDVKEIITNIHNGSL